jgi:hypothetical protein
MDDSQDVIEEDNERDVDEFNLIMRRLFNEELGVEERERERDRESLRMCVCVSL